MSRVKSLFPGIGYGAVQYHHRRRRRENVSYCRITMSNGQNFSQDGRYFAIVKFLFCSYNSTPSTPFCVKIGVDISAKTPEPVKKAEPVVKEVAKTEEKKDSSTDQKKSDLQSKDKK